MHVQKIVDFMIKPIAFVAFPLPSPSLDLKVPINKPECQGFYRRFWRDKEKRKRERTVPLGSLK